MTNYILSMGYNNYAHLNVFLPEYEPMIIRTGYDIPKDASPNSILILHGGQDISPSIYNHQKNILTNAGILPSERDNIELKAISRAMKHNMYILGLCRGAQLLCAVAGGSLYQHVYGHQVNTHPVKFFNGPEVNTNSEHHQMMCLKDLKEGSDYELIGWSPNRSYNRYSDKEKLLYYLESNTEPVTPPSVDPEVVEFPKIKGFAIQGHPEWMHFDNPFVHVVYYHFKGIPEEQYFDINNTKKSTALTVVK